MTNKTKTRLGWSVKKNDFYVNLEFADEIPAGIYICKTDYNDDTFFRPHNVVVDQYVPLPDFCTQDLVEDIQIFWESKHLFELLGHVHKRGILLYGTPGCGKSTIVRLVTQDILDRKGIVVLCDDPSPVIEALQNFRKVQPDTPCVIIMEDIDSLVTKHGEREILALLDGEKQIQNVVCIATTNYPEDLTDRIIRRPGRFDSIVNVKMPSDVSRRAYIDATIKKLPEAQYELIKETYDLDGWVKDTEGLGIPHLKELILSVAVLGLPYDTVLSKIKDIKTAARSSNESKSETPGSGFGFKKTNAEVLSRRLKRLRATPKD